MSVITTKDGIKYEGESSGSLDNFNVYTKTESDSSYVKLPTVDATQLIDLIYPVGSIYMSVTQTSPASFLGGNWTPLEEGKALWTTTTASTGGATIDAGLPNITGSLSHNYRDDGYSGALGGTGAFYTNGGTGYFGVKNALEVFTTPYYEYSTKLLFSAQHEDSSVYGNSSTVQPPAIKVYAWQRTP